MPEVYQNGTSAALVCLSGVHDFAGVIMPMRMDFNHTGAKVESRFTN